MFVLFEQRFQKRWIPNYRVTAFSEQKVFPFNHFRFDSILSFREDTADEIKLHEGLFWDYNQ